MIKTSCLLAGAVLALGAFSVQAEDLSAGESLYGAACAQCHGRAGRGSGSFPSLTGQEEDTIADLLQRYRAGERVGPNSALMRGPSKDLSDEDIADLAAYISATFQ